MQASVTKARRRQAPDAKTVGRWGVALGPEVLKQVHERLVQIARDKGVTAGRRMRVDTTVVETDIHHPTDSTVLGDGVRPSSDRRCARRPFPAGFACCAQLDRMLQASILRR